MNTTFINLLVFVFLFIGVSCSSKRSELTLAASLSSAYKQIVFELESDYGEDSNTQITLWMVLNRMSVDDKAKFGKSIEYWKCKEFNHDDIKKGSAFLIYKNGEIKIMRSGEIVTK